MGTEENILFMSVMNVFDVGGGITEHSTAILIFGRPSDRQYDTRASLMTKHMRGREFFCMYPKWLQLCTVLKQLFWSFSTVLRKKQSFAIKLSVSHFICALYD